VSLRHFRVFHVERNYSFPTTCVRRSAFRVRKITTTAVISNSNPEITQHILLFNQFCHRFLVAVAVALLLLCALLVRSLLSTVMGHGLNLFTGDDVLKQIFLIDEDDVDETLQVFFEMNRTHRLFKWQRERLIWKDHKARLIHQRSFSRMYRMSVDCFDRLLAVLIEPAITVNFRMSQVSIPGTNFPIYPELVVASALRYLACGSGLVTLSLFATTFRVCGCVSSSELS
jgi:hypothetical protein